MSKEHAIVTVRVKLNEQTIVKLRRSMSQELSGEEIGKLISEAIQESWRMGNDPTTTHIVVTFA